MSRTDVSTKNEIQTILEDGLKVMKSYNEAVVKSIQSFENALNMMEQGGQKKKRGPGRPRKNVESRQEVVATPPQSATTKRGPGRPRKNPVVAETPVQKTVTATQKSEGRGRPSINEILSSADEEVFQMESNRIIENYDDFNEWYDESNGEREVWKIENGTYLGVIEGFYSSGTSGRYGITTRIFVNPESHLVPDKLKNNIETAAVNRIRYVEGKDEGLDYIEKQKAKIQEQFFSEDMPKLMKDHGKKGSVYAFHLDTNIRRDMNKMRVIFDHKLSSELRKEKINS